MTQFGRALAKLGICANWSQAKGRVERVKRTLQDRLLKELRLAVLSHLAAVNDFLTEIMVRFNERSVVPAACPGDRHRPVEMAPERLRGILCRREQRHVGRQLTL
jgi:hypothetical protein